MMPLYLKDIKSAKRTYFELLKSRTHIILHNLQIEINKNIKDIKSFPILNEIVSLVYNANKAKFSEPEKILNNILYKFIFLNPEELEKIVSKHNTQQDQEIIENKEPKKKSPQNQLIVIYNNIRKKTNFESLYFDSGINVCPYCNRLLIDVKGAIQMDHFYPKTIYPMLSLCFFNLIPSCTSCNKLKSDRILSGLENPYKSNYNTRTVTFHPVLRTNSTTNNLELSLYINYHDENIDKNNKNPHRTLKSISEGYFRNISYVADELRKYEWLNSYYFSSLKSIKSINEYIDKNGWNQLPYLMLKDCLFDEEVNLRPFEQLDRNIYDDILNCK